MLRVKIFQGSPVDAPNLHPLIAQDVYKRQEELKEDSENEYIEAALYASGYFREDVPLDGDTQALLRAVSYTHLIAAPGAAVVPSIKMLVGIFLAALGFGQKSSDSFLFRHLLTELISQGFHCFPQRFSVGKKIILLYHITRSKCEIVMRCV